ncbi:MAG: YggT family protein [Gammaproteobacteria bacterium]|nr:YggT family protein [Gammaproteobacteria bacterium]NIR82719.1 YggT family protein [Gammaproteobacteria bacterium]NIR89583.1 YggT family protein [Gammaproteobacteria bacterium]NIU03879.1 YggT family protein [Gammaproteobacteria bacterium]NIV51195.1 YggT family protein [Gammaproteobacteria bacterium]
MGTPYANNAATFLVGTLFGLYILIVMLRFLFQVVRADFYNDISQFVVKLTEPLLRPLRGFVPGLAGTDLSPVVLMLALKVLELWLTYRVIGHSANLTGLFVLSAGELLSLAINVFFFSILIQVILSWVNPGAYNPVISILYSLNEPLLGPARRLIPPLGGLDLSPIAVIIALQLVSLLLVAPITDMGRGLL